MKRTSALWSSVLMAAVTVLYLSNFFILAQDEEQEEGTCSNYTDWVHQEGDLLLYHFALTSSTQDEAKFILANDSEIPEDVTTVVVTAAEQTKGRGTNGRDWFGARGNTFVTICVRQKAWLQTKLTMTLLPLKVGTVMATRIDELIQGCRGNQPQETNEGLPAITTIKWPNDVLVDEQKISGVLIESEKDWFLIGIGVNVGHAPTVPSTGANSGRTATSIRDYCLTQFPSNSDEYVTMARELGQNMAVDISDWLNAHGQDTVAQSEEEQKRLLAQWRGWVDWDMILMLRDGDNKEPVEPLDIEPDGRLKIREKCGRERLVVTDYFF